MTELKLETLVLDGVRVVSDNVTGLVRLASEQAGQVTPTVIPSVKRHLLSNAALVESDARPRYSATNSGGNNAPRAGRLAVSAGVPNCRIPPTGGGRPKTVLPLRSCLSTRWLRSMSGRIGDGFGQPFQVPAFTSQLPTPRHCPQWQKRMTRMPAGGR
jgi:hypothetical protein